MMIGVWNCRIVMGMFDKVSDWWWCWGGVRLVGCRGRGI